jgi:hypothetical protein
MELKRIRSWFYFVMLVRAGRSGACAHPQLTRADR